MSTAIAGSREQIREPRAPSFWQSTNGKKAVMAVTGAILFLFVIGHLAGNLQIFESRERLNAYGQFLKSLGELLWLARIGLIVSVMLHISATVQLALINRKARPVGYKVKKSVASNYADRTMYWSGPIVLAFIIFHLLQFTAGYIHPEAQFIEGDVYHNLVVGLSGLVGFGVVHLRDDPPGFPSAPWHLEHVSVGGNRSPSSHADPETRCAVDCNSDRPGIHIDPDQHSAWTREIT